VPGRERVPGQERVPGRERVPGLVPGLEQRNQQELSLSPMSVKLGALLVFLSLIVTSRSFYLQFIFNTLHN